MQRFLFFVMAIIPSFLMAQKLEVTQFEVVPEKEAVTVREVVSRGYMDDVKEYPGLDTISARNILFKEVEERFNESAGIRARQEIINLELNSLTAASKKIGYGIEDYQAEMNKVFNSAFNGKWAYFDGRNRHTLTVEGRKIMKGGDLFATFVPKARNLILVTFADTGKAGSFASENGTVFIANIDKQLHLLQRLGTEKK